MVEKIDLINENIYCYSSSGDFIKSLPITEQYSSFISEFSDTQDLLTINISEPIKRIMKFYDINRGEPSNSVELDYLNMTIQQKNILDIFISEVIL